MNILYLASKIFSNDAQTPENTKKISDENNYKYSKKGKWGDNLYCDYDLPLCVTFLYFLCYLGIWENILLYVVMDIYAILVKLCFHWAIVKTACDCNHWRWIFMTMMLSKIRNLVCKNYLIRIFIKIAITYIET